MKKYLLYHIYWYILLLYPLGIRLGTFDFMFDTYVHLYNKCIHIQFFFLNPNTAYGKFFWIFYHLDGSIYIWFDFHKLDWYHRHWWLLQWSKSSHTRRRATRGLIVTCGKSSELVLMYPLQLLLQFTVERENIPPQLPVT